MAKLVPAVAERIYLQGMMPLVRSLARSGVTPNGLTTVGAILIILSGVSFSLGQVRWAGALLLLSGVIDTLDGQVARLFDQISRFGAFYDSTLDRIGDGVIFIGLAIYFHRTPDVPARELVVALTLLGMLATQLVSYMRARAEGLGLECKVGVAQRAERILALGLPALFFGSYPALLAVVVLVLTILSVITVGQRFIHVYHVSREADGH